MYTQGCNIFIIKNNIIILNFVVIIKYVIKIQFCIYIKTFLQGKKNLLHNHFNNINQKNNFFAVDSLFLKIIRFK